MFHLSKNTKKAIKSATQTSEVFDIFTFLVLILDIILSRSSIAIRGMLLYNIIDFLKFTSINIPPYMNANYNRKKSKIN